MANLNTITALWSGGLISTTEYLDAYSGIVGGE